MRFVSLLEGSVSHTVIDLLKLRRGSLFPRNVPHTPARSLRSVCQVSAWRYALRFGTALRVLVREGAVHRRTKSGGRKKERKNEHNDEILQSGEEDATNSSKSEHVWGYRGINESMSSS